MNLYRIIAFSEAEHRVCFVEYGIAPAEGPDTPEAVIEHHLKWHPTLGNAKFLDVKFLAEVVCDTDALTLTGTTANGLPLVSQRELPIAVSEEDVVKCFKPIPLAPSPPAAGETAAPIELESEPAPPAPVTAPSTPEKPVNAEPAKPGKRNRFGR